MIYIVIIAEKQQKSKFTNISNNMDFDQVTQTINSLLLKEQPSKFSSSWIYKRAPKVYRYIWVNVKTELGDIDWDNVICKLDRPFQERWICRRPKKVKLYRSIREVKIVLKKYNDKRYVFLAPVDDGDKLLRDVISVALVRLAQKGNLRAQQELVILLRFMVDQWIEFCPRLWKWKGYTDDLEDKIKGCIRCYRFTGTFIGYLFKTLEYAGRGLRRMQAYSLDDTIFDGDKRIIDSVVQDTETNEIRIYDRTK